MGLGRRAAACRFGEFMHRSVGLDAGSTGAGDFGYKTGGGAACLDHGGAGGGYSCQFWPGRRNLYAAARSGGGRALHRSRHAGYAAPPGRAGRGVLARLCAARCAPARAPDGPGPGACGRGPSDCATFRG